MTDMKSYQFTDKASGAFLLSNLEAKGLGSDGIDTAHLLLGLLNMREGMAEAILQSFGLSAKDIRARIEKLVRLGTSMTAGDIGEATQYLQPDCLPLTKKPQAVFRLGMEEARNAGHARIGTGHLLLGLCRQSEGVVSEVLTSLGLSPDRVRNELLRLQQKYAEFVKKYLERYPDLDTDDPLLIAILREYAPSQQRSSLETSAGTDEEVEVICLLDRIIRQAIKERAKEIHIEPLEGRFSLRFLIDGALQEITPPTPQFLAPIIGRLKILAKPNLAEQRQSQEGSFRMRTEGRELFFKVFTKSVPGGEKAIIILT